MQLSCIFVLCYVSSTVESLRLSQSDSHAAYNSEFNCGLQHVLEDPYGAEDRLTEDLKHCSMESNSNFTDIYAKMNLNMEMKLDNELSSPRKQVLWVHLHKYGGSF